MVVVVVLNEETLTGMMAFRSKAVLIMLDFYIVPTVYQAPF